MWKKKKWKNEECSLHIQQTAHLRVNNHVGLSYIYLFNIISPNAVLSHVRWFFFFVTIYNKSVLGESTFVSLFFLIGFYWSYKLRACMERNLHQRWHLLNPSTTLVLLCDFDLIIKTHCEPLKLGFRDQQKINGMFPFSFSMEKSPQENFFVLWGQTALCTFPEVGGQIWSSHLRCLTCPDRNAESKRTKRSSMGNTPSSVREVWEHWCVPRSPQSSNSLEHALFFFSHPAIHANTSLIFFSRDTGRATVHDYLSKVIQKKPKTLYRSPATHLALFLQHSHKTTRF